MSTKLVRTPDPANGDVVPCCFFLVSKFASFSWIRRVNSFCRSAVTNVYSPVISRSLCPGDLRRFDRASADLLPPCDVGSSEGEGASPVECIADAGIPKWFARPRSVGAQTNPASHGRGRVRARAARWPIPIRWLLKLRDAHISKDQLARGTVRTSDCSLSDDPGKIRSILSARWRFAA